MVDVSQLVNQIAQIIKGVGSSSTPIVHSQSLGQGLLSALRLLVQLLIISLEALVKILKLLVH